MNRLLCLALMFVAILAGCSDDDDGPSPGQSATEAPQPLSGGITVFAASSLTLAFEEVGEAFTTANPETNVEFNFAGSQDLRAQMELGARADLFAAADRQQIDLAVASGVVVRDSEIFAGNILVVIVPKSNHAGITTLKDLARPGIKLVLASPSGPAGSYSRRFLVKASSDHEFGDNYASNVLANLVSEESNVRQVAARVQFDEADAGIVYASDVTPELAAHVETIEIPAKLNYVADYLIALTEDAEDIGVARAFIDFVLSDAGQAILVAHGFLEIE